MDKLNPAAWLAQREQEATRRRLLPLERLPDGRLRLAREGKPPLELLDFSSNDYLGLSRHPQVVAAAAAALADYGVGAGAARLMSGNLPPHRRLEELLAVWKGYPAALLFGSGYLANIGIIPALVGRADVIFSDRLNHASIYDGCRLAGARLVRFRHNDPNHLEELLKERRGQGEALIVAESIYSMDGDRAPLADLVELKERFGCRLLVDEAHATGLFGANGSGVVEEEGLSGRVDLVMGTLGKALGAYGAYLVAGQEMIDFILNRARSFIFATALPPAVAAAATAAVELVQAEPGLRQELWEKAAFFKARLRAAGIGNELGPSQIIPLLVGESGPALELAAALQEAGIFAAPVRPPTVPQGAARLRLSVCRHLGHDDLARAAILIGAAFEKIRAKNA